ncbi:glycoside hydrolase family 16 protein [Angustibacter sp. McL0619]|uniref:glycoside hydrolase family 16 protein n=1 Tax=Angustibacter sp. McL0619 TaxID=3415676 RepID=UPI003CEDC034
MVEIPDVEPFLDDFDGDTLDESVWLPSYLPAWSSLAEAAATYVVADSLLRLSIPPQQGVWCARDHRPPIRVSAVQSGNFSGPVGSTVGQQPFRDGLTVREEQEPFWGWTPSGGFVEVRMRGVVTARSMFAAWMIGLEDQPERCAELCIAEIFGDAVRADGSCAVGSGLHAFRDPDVEEDFDAVRLPIDPAELHTYAVDWRPDRAQFLVDGEQVRSVRRPPRYPMQLVLAVFDFPDRAAGDDDAVPELVVDLVRSQPSRR